jgi:SAM-dependent methyltransferase
MPTQLATKLPDLDDFETVACFSCGADDAIPFITAEDDLTGKPGLFTFVRCARCGLVYQSPRLNVERIKDYYDDEYIAHRKKTRWGILTPLYNRAMEKHDRRKAEIVDRHVKLGSTSEVLDVGCGAGTFLRRLQRLHGVRAAGVDFKDLSMLPGIDELEFHCGLFYGRDWGDRRFDLITMWHFLEHDYEPLRTLRLAGSLLKPEGRLVIEVPRLDSVSFRLYRSRWPGLQAPQHTVLYTKDTFLRCLVEAGLEVVEYLPYGAFPAYFYLFAGAAFKLLRGRGLNPSLAIYPYFVGQLLLSPLLLWERQLNLAMQTAVCRRTP